MYLVATALMVTATCLEGAPIIYRSSSSDGATQGDTTLSISRPAGTIASDVMVAGVTVTPNTTAITAPVGWTLLRRIDNVSGARNSLAIYWRTAGTSEPATYTWMLGATTAGAAGGIQCYSGVNPSTPIDAEAGVNTASSLSHTAPSITTTVNNTMLLTWHAFSSAAAWTPPSGMVEVIDRSSEAALGTSGVSLEGNMLALPTAGGTGSRTATASNNADVGNCASVALRSNNVPPGAANLSAPEVYAQNTALDLVNIVATDGDSASITATLTLSYSAAGSLTTGVSGAVTSTYSADTGVWRASGPLANVNALLAGVQYVPALNFVGDFDIATSVSDGESMTTGNKPVSSIGQLQIAQEPGGGLHLTGHGRIGSTYVVEYSETLTAPQWHALGSAIVDGGGSYSLVDPATSAPRFYRAYLQQ